jgi:hypothetical protein
MMGDGFRCQVSGQAGIRFRVSVIQSCSNRPRRRHRPRPRKNYNGVEDEDDPEDELNLHAEMISIRNPQPLVPSMHTFKL